MNPTLARRCLAVALTALLVGGVALVVAQSVYRATTLTAVFTSATAIYPGDEVRIAGVKVGHIESIHPDGAQVQMTLSVDRSVPVSAEVRAVIVAQNLVSARYVQLTPPFDAGPVLGDGGVIPVERTAIPVEWDQVKAQLARLATDLGPGSGMSTGSMGKFIDSAADALGGNGDKLRQTLVELSGLGRILAEGSGNIADMIVHLQTFVDALRDSNQQIVQFQDRLASLTSVLDGGKSDLDGALTDLADVVGEVQRFIAGSRDGTAEQIRRLANVTQNLADHRMDLEQVLHTAAPALANSYNMFDPRTGAASGVFVLNSLSDPAYALCGMVGAVENITAPETSKLCYQSLGPALDTISANYLPFPFNAVLGSVPPPDELIYTDPALAPGGAGVPNPAGDAPAVSAYTGAGDVPPPPGYSPLPSAIPPTLSDMLLPAERPQS